MTRHLRAIGRPPPPLRVAASEWLVPASDLLELPDPGPTPFLVDELLADGSIGVLQGAPKTGKTFLMLALARAVTSGRPALGRFGVPRPGPVVAVLEESPQRPLRRRLHLLNRGDGTAESEVRDLYLSPNRGVRLNTREWKWRISEAVMETRARAIFLDPFARLKGTDVDENRQAEIAPILEFLLDLRDATGAAVVFVHHTGHEAGRLRGSSDLEAVWESKLVLSRDERGICTLEAEHRDAAAAGPWNYRLLEADDSLRLELLDKPAKTPKPDLADAIVAFLEEHRGAATEEIARAEEVHARASTVRKILHGDPRFVQVPAPPGKKHNAKCWGLSALLVPENGPGRDGQRQGQAASCPSETPPPPLGGEGRDGAAPGPRPDERTGENG